MLKKEKEKSIDFFFFSVQIPHSVFRMNDGLQRISVSGRHQ